MNLNYWMNSLHIFAVAGKKNVLSFSHEGPNSLLMHVLPSKSPPGAYSIVVFNGTCGQYLYHTAASLQSEHKIWDSSSLSLFSLQKENYFSFSPLKTQGQILAWCKLLSLSPLISKEWCRMTAAYHFFTMPKYPSFILEILMNVQQ